MRAYLTRVREKSLELEAVLRSCELITATRDGVILACPYEFHRNKLRENAHVMEEIFGHVEVFNSKDDYEKEMMEDPLVRFAVNELGAQIGG